MNIVKETRFVWFVVLLLVVFAFAAHKKGGYDRDNDRDFAHGENPPPPPSPGCFPGFQYGAFGASSITFSGGGVTDSYNSSLGPYGSTAVPGGGNIGTNGAGCNSITLSGSTTDIQGNLDYGAGGSACAVNTTGGATYTGTASAQSTNTALPSIVNPTDIPNVGATNGDQTLNVDTTLAPGLYGDVKVQGGSNLTLNAGTYVFDSLTLSGNSFLTVGSGPILIYIPSGLDLSGGAVVNTSAVPSNLVFLVANTCPTVKLSGGTAASFAVYAPDSNIDVTGGGDVYGAVVGKTVKDSGGSQIHYDQALASFSTGTFMCVAKEVSRSSPVIAAVSTGVNAIVQGTFNTPTGSPKLLTSVASVATWAFPYILGHLRARDVTTLTTTAVGFGSGALVFSAGPNIAPTVTAGCSVTNGTCRNVFTNTTAPDATGLAWHPTKVQLNDGNASTIGPLIAADGVGVGKILGISGGTYYRDIIRGVLNADLGGVDRSTAAVIGPSTVAGLGTRPTIAYFGATDGMLHAVCATTGGTTESQASPVCPGLGTELWAFMPRTQLPLLLTNTQRIDGSPRVIDAFGDFSTATADGTRRWRTILTFQTGTKGSSTGATYALDVTDPALPVILWEYTTPAAPGADETGTGLNVAAGQMQINGHVTNLAVVETNNGGTGGAGVVTTALQLENGSKLWQFKYRYPTTVRGVPADLPLPASGIPGGAVGVDLTGSGVWTDVVFGDLYGDLWQLKVTDGTSRNGGSSPLFSFSTNKHPIGVPPAIYASGTTQYAAFVSGGYADPVSNAWTTPTQYLIAAKLVTTTAATATEGTAKCANTCALAVATTLTGDKGFSQALVVGGQLFVATDSGDVNSSTYTGAGGGHLLTVNTLTAGVTVVTTTTGASGSLVNSGSNIYNSTGMSQGVLAPSGTAVTGTLASTGSVDTAQTPKITRNLWLRTQ